ncbi:MAG TPA: hypothetical protein VF043_33775 [Ktedonobacteraceae bacterium]
MVFAKAIVFADRSGGAVLLLDMVDNSTSPLQTHFWLVFGDEAV